MTTLGPTVLIFQSHLLVPSPPADLQTTQFGEEINHVVCVCPKFPEPTDVNVWGPQVPLCAKYTFKVQIPGPDPRHSDALLPSAGGS